MLNLSSEQFNSIEGTFWIILGIVVWWFYFQLNKKFKSWAVFTAFILITFGISDYLQVIYGSFLQPHLLWLYIWKIIDVIGLLISIIWYFIIRLRND